MSLRPLARLAVHWLVILSMVATGLVVPAQAAVDAWQEAGASQSADEMAGMPCDDMAMPAATDDAPCDCCMPASCDLSACMGTACLPELPRMAAHIPPPAIPVPWAAPAVPSRLLDTPLRPPIA